MSPEDISRGSSAFEAEGKHRTGLLTLLFTDVVGSTQLKAALGDQSGVTLIQSHHALVRRLLESFPEAEEISTAGDSFLLVFAKPSDALRFSLRLLARLHEFNQDRPVRVEDRIGLHMGEVVIEERQGRRDIHGMQVDTCARVMSLAGASQILMTLPVFDNARQSLKGEEIEGVGSLDWLNHGRFELKGVQEPMEICEVRPAGATRLPPPTTSEKARRVEAPEGEAVLGWRPAVGNAVPSTKWILEQKLGEGGFGEVWLGRHETMKERRVFKFCFRADRVRSLKREMTLFRLLKERIGDHPNIVSLREVYFDQPPFYLEEDYVAGQDLANWCVAKGGAGNVPLETRLELVAQIADALQAAHDAGVIHRDVKPGNILVSTPKSEIHQPSILNPPLSAKLTDFGIGQVISEESLAGVTRAGFTQTMLSSGSSQTGTQLYMAPELLEGKPASTRSDIYSLGVVLYQLLIADFQRSVTTDWSRQVKDPLLRADLERCFAGDPTERFAGAAQLADNLRHLAKRRDELEQALRLDRRAKQRHRAAVVSAGVIALLLLLAGALGYGFWRTQKARELAEAQTYAVEMNLAQQALAADDLGKARVLLERYRPGSGREHLRGIEWRYLVSEAGSDFVLSDSSLRDAVYRMSLSPDGRVLAVGRYGGAVELWDAASLTRMRTLETNVPWAAVAFSPGGNLLAASGPDGIRLWQLEPCCLAGELVNSNRASRLWFSPDGQHLAALQGANVCVWNVESRTMVRSFTSSRLDIHDSPICFSPKGDHLAVGERSGHIRILDWGSGSNVADIPAHSQPVKTLVYSPDGKLLASGSGYSPEEIRLWNPATGRQVGSLAGHRSWIATLEFSGDGRQLFSGSADQTIGIWDVSERRLLSKVRGHLDEVYNLAPDERRGRLISGAKDGTLAVYDFDKVRRRVLRFDLPGWTGVPTYVGNESTVAVLDREGAVNLWQPAEPRKLSVVHALGTNNSSLAGASERGLLACAASEGPIRIWSLKSRTVLTNFGNFLMGTSWGGSHALKFSRRGEYLLAMDRKSLVTVWDAKTWTERFRCKETAVASYAVLSPNGRLLVAGTLRGTLAWWDVVRGQKLGETAGHRQAVSGIEFSPDGRILASVSEDGTLALWETTTRRQTGHGKADILGLHSLAISFDGTRLALGLSGGNALRLWDVKTRRELVTLAAPGTIFIRSEFSPEGDSLLCGERDGRSYLWRIPSLVELDRQAAPNH